MYLRCKMYLTFYSCLNINYALLLSIRKKRAGKGTPVRGSGYTGTWFRTWKPGSHPFYGFLQALKFIL